MSLRLKISVGGLITVVAIPVVILIGIWIFLLFSPNTILYSWAAGGIWPVACSTRGCVTTKAWAQQYSIAERYAEATHTDRQTPTEALTTLIHHHLLGHAFFKSPVTIADARRYREQVLNVRQGEQIQKITGVPMDVYDESVILPFLQQEALRQELKVESTEELYKLLSKERYMVSLLRHFRWNREEAIVEQR